MGGGGGWGWGEGWGVGGGVGVGDVGCGHEHDGHIASMLRPTNIAPQTIAFERKLILRRPPTCGFEMAKRATSNASDAWDVSLSFWMLV